MSRILLFVGIVALAVMTGRATEPQPAPAPTAVAQHVAAPEAPPAAAYTCTSPSSCAVLAAALNGPTAQPQPSHRQPRAHSTQRRSSGAQHEDQPGWNCARQGNHVCGDGVAGGPTASGRCPAGGTRVYGTPHGCRYR